MYIYKFETLLENQTYLYIASNDIDGANTLSKHIAKDTSIRFLERRLLSEVDTQNRFKNKVEEGQPFIYYSNFLPF